MLLFTNGIVITELEEAALKHDLLDIEAWLTEALIGKINNCKKRMINNGMEIIKSDALIERIPKNDDALIELIRNHSNYKNRAARDLENKIDFLQTKI